MDRQRVLVESIKRLLRRNAIPHLSKIVNKAHVADLTSAFRTLSISNQCRLFNLIESVEQKGILFSALDSDTFLDILEGMAVQDVVEIFEQMPTDDVADLIERMPEEKADTILEKMKQEGSEEVEGLLYYDNDTAGGIMVPDFIALREDTTAGEAIKSLQKEHVDVEMPFYLYVVDEYERLVGVSSLRQLVVVSPDKALKDFMVTDVVSVQTDMDQEEVARIVANYDILAVPVVDDKNRLVGIVTVDDVIDIIRREATEDILKMAGAGEEFVETKSIARSTRIRLPWLFVSCVGGVIAFFIIGYYEETLTDLIYLAAFIPVIMNMGGNIGTQSSSIVVRGLATGRIHTREIWSVVFKELSIGFILGSIYGSLVGIVAQFQFGVKALAFSVGIAVVSSMTIAALVGSLVPMLLARVHIDPAVASSPFVTTSIDIISVSFYFMIATALLSG